MKFVATIKPLPLGLSREDAIEYLGSIKLFTDCEAVGWIKSVVRKTRFVLYDRAAIDSAWQRVVAGEYPGVSAA